ncbi:EAL domain-containing protein [Alteromonas flava]|uniref:EAL domain-containing protein n=1 Tax=Alteromonas flava TaxID=2048003 RepID=UPI001F0BEF9F|nr:EAL domain-containing protein [Alteromonas flava]
MLQRFFSSIRTSLLLSALGFTLLLTCAVMWLVVKEHQKLYLDGATANLTALADNIGNDLLPLIGPDLDIVAVTSALLRLDAYPDVITANLYDRNLTLVQQYVGRAGRNQTTLVQSLTNSISEPSLGTYLYNDYLYSVKRIGERDFPKGYLVVVNDIKTTLERSQQQLVMASLPFLFIIFLVLSVVYSWALRKRMRPLIALSDFTQRLQFTKDYSQRFAVGGKDEVSGLARNINGLVVTIENELKINREQTAKLIEQQRTMTRLANYDSLTGLPNRQFVMDTLKLELARALRSEQDLVLMFFDLDGFKSINDSLGHETGDKVLVDVAGRVSSLMRDGDLVARLGGDEFLVIPSRDTTQANIHRMATRLIDAFQEPFCYNGLDLYVGVSIGVSKATDANFDINELVGNADIAMYRSKAAGKGTYTLFDTSMIEDHKRKLMIANSINSAITNDELRVHYQPKVGRDGSIVGFETLLRWAHPVLGMIPPAEFIPIAEQGGKIPGITSWVLERACKDLARIKSMFPQRFRVSVNLSAFDLKNPSLFDFITNLFERYSVDPRFFELEVTESAYLESFAASDKFFRRVSNMGCAISLDDFGTGYSSLGYLTQISIDTLKIDRQFVRELKTSERSRMVTGTIIDLAKRLNLTICAEGIEETSQIDYLVSQGCDHLQGFYFSKPISLEELAELPVKFPMPDIQQSPQLKIPYDMTNE